jgi:D-glycero-D-manno-heptose 1,7-bisphosphate phosphatase
MNKKLDSIINYDDIFCSFSASKKSFFCAKPNPGMILKAIKKHKINIKKSFLIDDRWSDIVAAERVICKSIFINRNYKERIKIFNPTKKVRSLSSAINYIERYN